MRAEISFEARELDAAKALDLDAYETQAWLADAPPSERVVRRPDTSTMAASAMQTLATDPWRAAIMAEVHVAVARRRAQDKLRRTLARKPVKLRGEFDPYPLDVVNAAMLAESNGARREALRVASNEQVGSSRADARAVIDALREALSSFDASLVGALAIGDESSADLLDATEDVFRELDERVCHTHLIDRAHLTWSDRLRTLFSPNLLAAIPTATWASLGARMFERVGLDRALRGVVNDLRPAGSSARGVFVLVNVTSPRAVIAGRPMLSAWGAADVLGALSVAAMSTQGRGPFPGVRRGCDRAIDGVAHALGRRLLGERHFLKREAGIDAVPRERVMIEVAHGELLRMRLDVALSRFAAHVLSKAPEAGTRFHDEVMRALGIAPPPSWAPLVAAGMFETGGFWGGRWMSRATGARVEPLIVAEMRQRYDEDWYRNPRAGEGLSLMFDELRAVGVRAWCQSHGGAVDASRTTNRFAEIVREAQRST